MYYKVIREREKLYSLLRQTSSDRLKTCYKVFTINPVSRYQTTTFHFNQERVHRLYDTDRMDDETDNNNGDRVVRRDRKRRNRRTSSLDVNRKTIFVAD